MKLFYFHPAALLEADEAAKFYEAQQKGLGKRFVEALADTTIRIKRNPKLYIEIENSMRKCRLLHFPFGVIYREKDEFIEIIAVMHLKRNPGYWKSRI